MIFQGRLPLRSAQDGGGTMIVLICLLSLTQQDNISVESSMTTLTMETTLYGEAHITNHTNLKEISDNFSKSSTNETMTLIGISRPTDVIAANVTWNAVSKDISSEYGEYSSGNSFISMTSVVTGYDTESSTSKEVLTYVTFSSGDIFVSSSRVLTDYGSVNSTPVSKNIFSSYETSSNGDSFQSMVSLLTGSGSVASKDIFSSYATYSRDSFVITTGFLKDYETANSTSVKITSTDASELVSNIIISFSEYWSETDTQINPTSTSFWTQTQENDVTPSAVTNPFQYSTSVYGSYSTEETLASIDEKVWAVPVTASLSVFLVFTWLILLLVCCKLNRRTDPSRGQNHREGEGLQQENESNIQRGVRHWQVENPEFSPSHEIQKVQTDREKTTSRHSRDSEPYLKSSHISQNDLSRKGREELKLENMPSPKEGTFPSHPRHTPQSLHEEFRLENEAFTYDNYSLTSNSPVSIHNRTNNMPSQQTDRSNTSSDQNRNLNFETLTIPNQNFKREADYGTKLSPDNSYFARPIYITEFSHTDERNKDQMNIELKSFGPNYPNECHVSDDSNDNDWGVHDGRYMYDESGDDENATMGFGNYKRKTKVSLDSTYSDCDNVTSLSSEFSKKRPGNSEKRTGYFENRPGMNKCVSFDDTHLQITQGNFMGFNNKSDSRKISTISESAAAYLTLPEESFMSMTTTYKTLNNLAEIGESPVGSPYIIGFSNDDNFPGKHNAKLPELVDYDERNKNDSINKLPEEDIFKKEDIKNMNQVTKNNDLIEEDHRVKLKDNYVFPIERKAMIKIRADRQQQKEMVKGRISNNRVPLTAARPWKKIERNSQLQINFQKEESNKIIGNLHSLSPSISMDTSSLPSRHKQNLSSIPTIILPQDVNEKEERYDNKNEVHKPPPTVPPRTRRKARANNPFLIEVDPPKASSIEKVRRSSAPSMAHSPNPTESTLTPFGMIRSVSGDRLYEHFRKFDKSTPTYSSKGFFDLIKSPTFKDPSEDDRLKKMVNERYDALFNNKTARLTRTSDQDMPAFRPNPRIPRLLTKSGRLLFPNEATGIAYYSGIQEIDQHEPISVFRPNIESNGSLFQHVKRNIVSTNPESGQKRSNSNLQTKSVTSAGVLLQDVRKPSDSKNVTPDARVNKNDDSHCPSFHENRSPRPSLTDGTDGQDSDVEIQKTKYVETWLKNSEANEEKPRPHSRNKNNSHETGEVPMSTIRWESFEDDSEKERLHSSVPNSSSQKERFSRSCLNSRNTLGNVLPRISERPWLNTEKAEMDTPRNGNGNFYTQGKLEDDIVKEDTKRSTDTEAWKSIDISQSSLPSDTPPTEQEPISPLPSARSPPPAMSSLKRASFDDNFDINTYLKNENAKRINQPNDSTTLENQLFQDTTDTSSQSKSMIPPEKPPRKAGKRASRNETFTSPYSLNDGKIKDVPAGEEETNRKEATTRNVIPDKTKVGSDLLFSSSHPRSTRSLSLEEFTNIQSRRNRRAATLATDKLQTGANDWSKLFGQEESRFISSASNTLLEHDVTEEPAHAISSLLENAVSEDPTLDNNSFSEPELEFHFHPKQTAINPNYQKTAKMLILSDDYDGFLQASNI